MSQHRQPCYHCHGTGFVSRQDISVRMCLPCSGSGYVRPTIEDLNMSNSNDTASKQTILRGFATLSPEARRELGARGGRAGHVRGTARQWTAEQASEAGRKGGLQVSEDRAHMKRIAAKGGEANRGKKRAAVNHCLVPAGQLSTADLTAETAISEEQS